MRLSVRTLAGQEIAVDAEPTDTVATVKQRIQDQEGVPAEQQLLVHGAEQLADGQTLLECGVQDEAVLSLALGQPTIQIFVKTVTGSFVTLDIEPSATIEALKRQVQAKEGIPVDHQRYVHHGQRLEDDRTVADYGIENEAVLNMVMDLRSG